MRFTLIVLSFLIIYSCSKDPNIVAKVGNLKVTKKEIKDELAIKFPGKDLYTDVDIKEKEDILNKIILNKLKLNEAFDSGLDKNEIIMRDYINQKRNIVTNRYYKQVVIDKLFPESLIQEQFEKIRKEVSAMDILISYNDAKPSMNSRRMGAALVLAKQVSQEAQQNEDFESLVKKYSDDPDAKTTSGHMGYFGWSSNLTAVKRAAFDFKIGEVSGPILTEDGYHIIKIIDKRLNERYKNIRFETQKDQLVMNMYNLAKDKATEMWIKHLEEKKVERDYRYNLENIHNFYESNVRKRKAENLDLKGFTDEELATQISTWNKGEFTVKDLLDSFGKRPDLYYSQLTDSTKLHDLIENISGHQFILEISEEMGIDKESDISFQLNKYMEYLLLKDLEQNKVRNEAALPVEEIRDYYDANRSEFTIPGKIEFWEIYLSDKQKAEKVFKMAKSGKNFVDLVKKYSEDKVNAMKSGYMGYKAKNERGEVSKTANEAGPGKIVGPVKFNNGWVIVKTGKVLPENVLPFDQCKAKISNKLLKDILVKKQEQWEQELRDSYSVDIYNDVLESI